MWNSVITENLNIYLCNYHTKTVISTARKHEKKNYGSYLSFCKYFLHFELLATNIIKNETREKVQEFTRNKYNKVFIQIPGTYKKTFRSYSDSNKCSK